MKRRFLAGGRMILEGGRLRAVLIREGRSLNGNIWTRPVLEQIAKLSKGLKISLYDFSSRGDRSHLSHWEFIRRNLPPAIVALLPERLKGAESATIVDAEVRERNGVAEVIADVEPSGPLKKVFTKVLEAARRLGKTVGLSIHVADEGFEGRPIEGGDFEPTRVARVVGYDIVSIPSAGGRILPVLEALARRTPMKGWLRKLLRLVPEDKRAPLEALIAKDADIKSADELLVDDHEKLVKGIVEALDLGEVDEDALGATLEAIVRTVPDEEPKPKAKPKQRAKKAGQKTRARKAKLESQDDPDDDPDDADGDDPDPLRSDVDMLLLEGGRNVIEAVLKEAKLPGGLPAFAKAQLEARLESAGRISQKDVSEFVDELKKSLGKSQAVGGGLLEGADPRVELVSEWSDGQRAELALEALIAGVPEIEAKDAKGNKIVVKAFPGIRRAYGEITGDVHCEGASFLLRQRRPSRVLESYPWEQNQYAMLRRARGLEAAVTTTGFADIITNVINKRLMREYRQLPHVWRRIATTTPVNDFKTRDIHRLGEYPNLSTVGEGVAYTDLALPTEEKVTAQIAKRGGLAPITWESVVNDDVRAFRDIPGKLARASDRTLNVSVWGHLLNNDAWDEDSVAFFHVSAWPTGHKNIVAGAYSLSNLEAARRLMTQQKDMDDREAGVVVAASVFCGTSKFDEVWTDLMSDRRPVLGGTDTNAAAGTPTTQTMQNNNVPNWARVRDGLMPYEVHEFDEVSGSEDDVIVAADPNVTEIVEVGFLNGREDPEIFVQNMERVGSFFDSDTITYKVRHVHDGGELVDPRGAVLIQAP